MDPETRAKVDRLVATAVENAGPQITDLAQRLKRAQNALAARRRAAFVTLGLLAAFVVAGVAWIATLSLIAEISVAALSVAVSISGELLRRRMRAFNTARAGLARREPLPEARIH